MGDFDGIGIILLGREFGSKVGCSRDERDVWQGGGGC